MEYTNEQIIKYQTNYLVNEYKNAKHEYEVQLEICNTQKKEEGEVSAFNATKCDLNFGMYIAYQNALYHLLRYTEKNFDLDTFVSNYKE